MATSLSIGVLGPPSVLVDGRPLSVDTRKATALLAVLAVAAEPVSRETLTALLWPESDAARASGALRRTLSVLRAALGGRWVAPSGGSLALDGPGCEVDIRRERDLWRVVGDHHRGGTAGAMGAGTADASRCAACLDRLERIAALHRGPLLAGLGLRDSPDFEDWQRRVALDAERRLAGALATLVDGRTRQGRLAEAISFGERWLALDVLSEPAHRALMAARAVSGDRAGAIRQYRECVRVLDEELSVEPLEETQALYRRIVAGEPAASGQGHDEGSGSMSSPDRRALARQPAPAPLVGRSRQLGALVSAWTAAGDGGSLAIVEGEPGIGKTRLIEELAGIVSRASGTVITLACYPGDRAQPYAALEELVRRAGDEPSSRLLALPPDVREFAASLMSRSVGSEAPARGLGPAADTAARAEFLDAAALLLVGLVSPATPPAAPTVFAIDDAQWLDDPTLQLLGSAAPRLRATRALVLVARRPVGIDPDPFRELERVFGRERVVHIGLDRLTRDETAELARLSGLPADGRDLYATSQGLPIHLSEHIAASQIGVAPRSEGARHEPTVDPDVADSAAFPDAVRDLLVARLDALTAGGAQVMAAAAIIGRRFDVDLVRAISGRSDEEVVEALEELVRVGLLRDGRSAEGGWSGSVPGMGPADTYAFDHPLTAGVVYSRLGIARRRLLHRRAAASLVDRQSRADGASLAAEVARHYRLAGEDARAAAFLEEAGRRAESMWANAEALADYRAAGAIEPGRLDVLRERMADLELLLGRYEAAVADLEAAVARTPMSDPVALGRLERKLAGVHRRTGRFALAEAHAELAMARLPGTERAERLATILERAMLAHRLGERERAARLVEEAVPMADGLGDAALAARAHNMAAIVARASDDPGSAVAHLRRSLDVASSAGSLEGRTAALNNLALVEREAGRLEQAVEFTMEALRACAQLGDRHREAALRNNLADLLRALGRQADAMDQVRQAVTILAAIGEPGELQPELWRLVEW